MSPASVLVAKLTADTVYDKACITREKSSKRVVCHAIGVFCKLRFRLLVRPENNLSAWKKALDRVADNVSRGQDEQYDGARE